MGISFYQGTNKDWAWEDDSKTNFKKSEQVNCWGRKKQEENQLGNCLKSLCDTISTVNFYGEQHYSKPKELLQTFTANQWGRQNYNPHLDERLSKEIKSLAQDFPITNC